MVSYIDGAAFEHGQIIDGAGCCSNTLDCWEFATIMYPFSWALCLIAYTTLLGLRYADGREFAVLAGEFHIQLLR